MSKRGLNINTDALYAASLQRDQVIIQDEEEPRPAVKVPFAPKFHSANKPKAAPQRSLDHYQPVVGTKTANFANEVQARLNAQRIADKVREAALKRAYGK
jgi:hypothetical protein